MDAEDGVEGARTDVARVGVGIPDGESDFVGVAVLLGVPSRRSLASALLAAKRSSRSLRALSS